MENQESLYRTRWLMAHNRLHGVCHAEGWEGWVDQKQLDAQWEEYLAELQTAEEITSRPA